MIRVMTVLSQLSGRLSLSSPNTASSIFDSRDRQDFGKDFFIVESISLKFERITL